MNAIDEEELFYLIALTKTSQIGDKLARALLSRFGTAKEIFNASPQQLRGVTNFGAYRIQSLKQKIDAPAVEKELRFIQKNEVRVLCLNGADYPARLKNCPDAPILLYFKGTANLNAGRIVAIVGTRKNTEYGLHCAEKLVERLSTVDDILIVSGLAHGIDGIAHKRAVRQDIPTLGVLAHGLDTLYPAAHRRLAQEMLTGGGLLTEFPSGTTADKQNFPLRNRIVAGLSDVTVVVETDRTGGSMITAKLAVSYNREIAAYPGRAIDAKSKGCNYLIQTNIAEMITHPDDLLQLMAWQKEETPKASLQQKLFAQLTTEEQKITSLMRDQEAIHIDELFLKSGIANAKLAGILLSLELNGLVQSLPGKKFRLL